MIKNHQLFVSMKKILDRLEIRFLPKFRWKLRIFLIRTINLIKAIVQSSFTKLMPFSKFKDQYLMKKILLIRQINLN